MQVINDQIPETQHDFSVELIITPDEVIRCPNRRRPRSIIWNDLTPEKISAIPALAAQADARNARLDE